MTERNLIPLDADIASLIAEERSAPAPLGADAAERVLARLEVTVAAPPGPSEGSGGARFVRAGAIAGHPAWRFALVLLAGSGAVAAMHAMLQRPEPSPIVHVEPSATTPAASATTAPTTSVRESPAPRDAPALDTVSVDDLPRAPASPLPSTAAHAATRDGQLAAERAILDVAWAALGRSDASGALVALDRHSARYPSGLLSEEREALAVRALIVAGRNDDARARGKRFAQRFPRSLLLPAVEASLQTIR